MSGEQVTDLDGLSYDEIAKLTVEGRLDALMRGEDPDPYGIEAARREVLAAKEAEENLKAPESGSSDQGARGTWGGPLRPGMARHGVG